MSDTLPNAHVSSLTTIHINLDPNHMYTDSDPTRFVTDLTTKLNPHGMTTLELDSHADTCVLGRDCLVILDYDQPVQVVGYDPALGGKPIEPLAESLPTMIQLQVKYFTW